MVMKNAIVVILYCLKNFEKSVALSGLTNVLYTISFLWTNSEQLWKHIEE